MGDDIATARMELRNVQAPSDLFDPVSDVLTKVDQRVLLASARLAKARVGAGETCVIDRKDILIAVHEVLTQTAIEIEKTLDDDESEFVRKAS